MFLNITTEYIQAETFILDIDSQTGYTIPITPKRKRTSTPENLKRAMFKTSSKGIAQALTPKDNG